MQGPILSKAFKGFVAEVEQEVTLFCGVRRHFRPSGLCLVGCVIYDFVEHAPVWGDAGKAAFASVPAVVVCGVPAPAGAVFESESSCLSFGGRVGKRVEVKAEVEDVSGLSDLWVWRIWFGVPFVIEQDELRLLKGFDDCLCPGVRFKDVWGRHHSP